MKHLRLIVLAALIPLVAHAAPIGERLQAAIDGPLSADPVRKNVSLGTTVVAAIATENAKKTSNDMQILVASNTHASHNVCVGSIAVTSGETCDDTLCATEAKWTAAGLAATMNCTANDASSGSLVLPGTQRQFRYDGTRCVCIVASGAGTGTQVERIVR
jgi:hypothetical protein